MSRPVPEGYQSVIERAHAVARSAWEAAMERQGWHLQRAEISSVEDAMMWLCEPDEDGAVWTFKDAEDCHQTALVLLSMRVHYRREFEARKGDR